MNESNTAIDTVFANDIKIGLTAEPKFLSSKYFYDDEGSRIFQEIMEMPEYYLTDAELDILTNQSKSIYNKLDFSTHFNLIELGAGDGKKTIELLRFLTENKIDFTYYPVDISEEANNILIDSLTKELNNIKVKALTGDYFKVLKSEFKHFKDPNLLLFLGSNVGNYSSGQVDDLLTLFNDNMKVDDKLLIGMDLKKNPRLIKDAYDDPNGITRRFNLNLLKRINNELDADFNIENFEFYCHYNPINGEVRSYLVSLKHQTVHINSIEIEVVFQKGELVSTELSKKYSLKEIEELASRNKFKTIHHFLDKQEYFTDSLWVK